MNKQERIGRMYEYLRFNGLVHTQRELAEKVGAGAPTISGAMRGVESCLTDSLLRRINRAFGYVFSEKWLMTGEGEMLSDKSQPTLMESPIRKRIMEVARTKGIDLVAIGNELGVGPSVSADAVARLVTMFPEVSADWILTGQGEMLRQASEASSAPQPWEEFVELIAEEVRRRMKGDG